MYFRSINDTQVCGSVESQREFPCCESIAISANEASSVDFDYFIWAGEVISTMMAN